MFLQEHCRYLHVRVEVWKILVQYFIDENEKTKEFDIILYTVTGAEELQNRYEKTSFVNIKRIPFFDRVIKRINPILYGINRRILKRVYIRILNSYERKKVVLRF